MKRKLKIYLDTSVINFLYYEQSPDYQYATIELFENFILSNKYEAYFSLLLLMKSMQLKILTKEINYLILL